jgi:hypothetical protein
MNQKIFGTPLVSYLPALMLTAVTIFYLASAYTYDAVAAQMPIAVGWILLILLALDLVSRTQTSVGIALLRVLNPAAEGEENQERSPFWRQASAMAWPAAYTAGLVILGVLIATPLYIVLSMVLHGRWSWLWSAITAILATVSVYLLFEVALQVRLYPGMILENL